MVTTYTKSQGAPTQFLKVNLERNSAKVIRELAPLFRPLFRAEGPDGEFFLIESDFHGMSWIERTKVEGQWIYRRRNHRDGQIIENSPLSAAEALRIVRAKLQSKEVK